MHLISSAVSNFPHTAILASEQHTLSFCVANINSHYWRARGLQQKPFFPNHADWEILMAQSCARAEPPSRNDTKQENQGVFV